MVPNMGISKVGTHLSWSAVLYSPIQTPKQQIFVRHTQSRCAMYVVAARDTTHVLH